MSRKEGRDRLRQPFSFRLSEPTRASKLGTLHVSVPIRTSRGYSFFGANPDLCNTCETTNRTVVGNFAIYACRKVLKLCHKIIMSLAFLPILHNTVGPCTLQKLGLIFPLYGAECTVHIWNEVL